MALNTKSVNKLNGVHPDLVRVVLRCAEVYEGNFTVTEGVRTLAKQKELVKIGASKTMNSRHIPENNQSKLACAVDLAAWLDLDSDGVVDNGEIRWDWDLYYDLAEAMKCAAAIEHVPLVWGGVWDREMTQYEDPAEASHQYVLQKRAAGVKRPFIDGPHFELAKRVYP